MIAVIDYGAGNLYSVTNALDLFGTEYRLARGPEELSDASAILLPGVGHFGQMMEALAARGLIQPMHDKLSANISYMGICLGMHALYESSEEAPGLAGLGLLKGRVLRFPPGEKTPHMGWSEVDGRSYYFAHSYYLPADAEGSAALARHGIDFTAIVRRGNLYGTQFHPEKSGEAGLRLLKEWVNSCQPNASSPAST
jgi:imidazole glycerol phosphate synthase glutamine amidotransferase subunit